MQGGTAKQIAKDLGITTSSVSRYAREYRVKLDRDFKGWYRTFFDQLEPGTVAPYYPAAPTTRKGLSEFARSEGINVICRSDGDVVWVARLPK